LSMAHGLENRVPFLDNDLVDFAMECPVSLKLKNFEAGIRLDENVVGDKQSQYFRQTQDGKQILRKVMEKIIPSEITDAKKQGFSGPDASWFKGDSIEFVKQKLFSGDTRIYSLLDRQSVQNLVHEHLNGKINRRLLIWSLLNLEVILETEMVTL